MTKTVQHDVLLIYAIEMYRTQRLSQGDAARYAQLSRAEFIECLGQAEVTPFQGPIDELFEEARRDGVDS